MNIVDPIREKECINAVKRILRESGSRNLLLFLLGINTGLRVSDLLRLRVKDVKNKDSLQIREKKTHKIKKFPMSKEIRIFIDEYVERKALTRYLFKSKKTNKPITRIQAYRIIKDACDTIGIEHTGTHSLRKTFGYHLYKQTKDIALLQKVLNHSSQDITLRYIGVTQEIIDDKLKMFAL